MFYNTVNKASVFELLSIVKVSDLQTTCRLLGERVKAQQHKHFNKSISFLKPNSSIDLSQINIDCYCHHNVQNTLMDINTLCTETESKRAPELL